MPFLILGAIARLLIECTRAILRQRIKSAPEPLCAECACAHVQYLVKGPRAISCAYAGTLRPMKLDVLYCTDFRARNQPIRKASVGFVREIAAAE
jgi:hypothetical protein